jgi:hypothetical protein
MPRGSDSLGLTLGVARAEKRMSSRAQEWRGSESAARPEGRTRVIGRDRTLIEAAQEAPRVLTRHRRGQQPLRRLQCGIKRGLRAVTTPPHLRDPRVEV